MSDETTGVEALSGGESAYRATAPELMRLLEDAGETPVLEGRMMPYNEWTEVNSPIEGHFMERFAPGSLAKTMSEQGARIRALFEHGFDAVLGMQAIADVPQFREEDDGAYFRADLLDGLPPLLVSGLRRGLYGSSIRFKPVKGEKVRSPKPSDYNPKGLPEITYREASMREFSVVTFPQYAGATAHVRSITDEIRQLRGLTPMIESKPAEVSEPQHSDSSRSTQPTEPISREEFIKRLEADTRRR